MKNCAIKRFVIAGLFLILLPTIGLAVPGLINYQGVLTDSAGAPINGTRPVVFSMYTTATGGTALWTENRTITATNGVFDVLLGSVTPVPGTLFQTDAVYLGITVDTDPEMTPRQRMTSVCYAFQAGSAVTAADAVHAASADLATNATNAADATHALSADSATNATNADLLDGMHSSDIISAGADEVRTPISSVPFTINTAGSYYFTGNLAYTTATGNAITVNADDVKIDLMGYRLTGPGSASGVNYGIYMSVRKNVQIVNGTVRDFGRNGISDGSADSSSHTVMNVRVIGNGTNGILLSGSGNLVRDCVASDNGGVGIYTYAGSTITNSTAYNNQLYGINAQNGCTITCNSAVGNQQAGIYGYYGCTISGNTACDNQYNGILAFSGCTVTNNTARNNNQSDNPSYAGIYAYQYCAVKGNTVEGNLRNDIIISSQGNDIEDNLATNSGYGIYFSSASNFYANNRAYGNTSADYGGNTPTGTGDGGGNVSF